MTAEIAIMNKSAVALAADSAVTIGGERNQKIFNTVNKLFTLSKYHPVGVMVYGNAQIMRVPWETLVKVYRAQSGNRQFAHLEDYAADFLKFLARSRAFFPEEDQRDYFSRLLSAFYRSMNEDIEGSVKSELERAGQISSARTRTIIAAEIARHHTDLQKCKPLRGFTRAFERKLLRKYASIMRKLRADIFQNLPFTRSDSAKIRAMSGWLFTRDNFRLQGASGVVVAGFGQKDIYPRLVEYTVEGVIQNRLRFRPRRTTRIGRGCSSSIVPFAQSEVVQGFIDGVDPGIARLLNSFFTQVFTGYPTVLLNQIKGLSPKAKASALKKTRAASEQILKKFKTDFEEFRKKMLVDPIVFTVAVLPKEELAAMAEALVNLTSFKRRFSLDAETVGGPIDVAVLSKGDGFIWVKRKHYFTAELNPHFLANYLRNNESR